MIILQNYLDTLEDTLSLLYLRNLVTEEPCPKSWQQQALLLNIRFVEFKVKIVKRILGDN